MSSGRSWRLLAALGTAMLAAGMPGLAAAPARADTAGPPAGGGLAPAVLAVIGIVIVGPALALLIVARRRRGPARRGAYPARPRPWHRKRIAK